MTLLVTTHCPTSMMSLCWRAELPCFLLMGDVLPLQSPLLPSDSHVIVFTFVSTITSFPEEANNYQNGFCSKLETAVALPSTGTGPTAVHHQYNTQS